MSFKITQKCDRCSRERSLEPTTLTDKLELGTMLESHGWVEVRPRKHICGPCIKEVLNESPG